MSILTGIRRAIGIVVAAVSVASSALAQRISTDSIYDYADSYWRGRLTVSAASGDSLGITCGLDYKQIWVAEVRFFGAEPWSPDALSTSTTNFVGFSSSTTSSRMTVMWPDNDRDRWQITFITGRGRNWIGPATSDGAAARRSPSGSQNGWLSDGDGFLRRLVKHGRVAITYPVADWVRSFEMVFTPAQVDALRAMYARCSKDYEGTRRPRAAN